MAERVLEVPTEGGPARVHLTPEGPHGLLCLGHGAGGGVDAADLVATAAAAAAAGWTVARVEQPYRVAGRRAPDRAPRLDAAWVAVVRALRAELPRGPLVVGGRSSGARVACRTAQEVGAAGVVCLAFPLRPPTRRRAGGPDPQPRPSRLPELLGVTAPCLVVQGERDPFGGPSDFPAEVAVVAVPGDHSLRRAAADVAGAVVGWLGQRVA